MGQYYKVINTTKEEYLDPHKFGDGLKLTEFGSSGSGTMCGLAILLANSNNRGSGDLRSENSIVGSWAGDCIVIAGDYATLCDPGECEEKILYDYANDNYTDISDAVIEAMCDDSYLKKDLIHRGCKLPSAIV